MFDPIPIPPQAREALSRALERTPGEDLLRYAREHLRGSFTKPALVRQHLQQQLGLQKELTAGQAALLRRALPGSNLVLALDPAALATAIPALIALVGRETLTLLLLTDHRQDARHLGTRLLANPDYPAAEISKEEAFHYWSGQVRDWLEELQIHAEFRSASESAAPGEPRPAVPEQATPAAAEAPGSAGRIERLEKILEDQKRRHKEEIRALRERLQAERAASEAARRELEEEHRRAVEACARAEGALQAERAAREAVIQTAIENEKKSLLRPWLREAESILAAAQSSSTDDLMARVQAVLEAQRKADRVVGTRRELEEKLAKLRAAHSQLVDAGSNSLNPLTELTSLRGRVEAEIQRLERALGRGAADSEIVRQLRQRIADARTAEQLWAIRPALDALQEHRLAAPSELMALERTLLNRVSVLAESRPVDAPLSQEQSWSLRTVLARRIPSRLLVDGHNVILSLPAIFGEAGQSPQAEKRAREQLASAIIALGERHPSLEIELHLDGPVGRAESARRNVRIEYSGGTGAQRADSVILGRLRHLTMSDVSRPCYLVTDDRRLRDDAQREGARCVRTTAFVLLLEDSGGLQARTLS